MLALVVVAVAAAQCCKSVSAGAMDHYIHVRSSIDNSTREVANNGILNVSKEKSGYLLCNASAVFNSFNTTTYYWDYSVRWEMPTEVENDTAVFQMGKDYQMPHSYLVFKRFRPNFKGRYQCHLLFKHTKVVGTHVMNLSLSPDGSTH